MHIVDIHEAMTARCQILISSESVSIGIKTMALEYLHAVYWCMVLLKATVVVVVDPKCLTLEKMKIVFDNLTLNFQARLGLDLQKIYQGISKVSYS